MPDVGDNDLAAANDVYNARLEAAGVPDEGFGVVAGGMVHGGLFDDEDALAMAESIAAGYCGPAVDAAGVMFAAAQSAVHGMAIGVLAERARWESATRSRVALLRVLTVIAKGQVADAQEYARLTVEAIEGHGNGEG